jgi:gamma-glutamylcyclotransferase (GGCT)/AIG2-like uncharacterized protein YtfP
MILIFVYGTLMKNFWNNYFLEDSEFLGEVQTVERYGLYIEGLIPKLNEEKNYVIYGELYNISKDTLQKIDSLEGNDDEDQGDYFRKIIQVSRVDGKIYNNVWAYINNNREGVLSSIGDFREYFKAY